MARIQRPEVTKPNDREIRLFIAKQFIDEPHLMPPLGERIENVGTIQSLYWRSEPEDRTARQVREATPATSRIRRAFLALESEGVVQQVERGWNLTEEVIAACAANLIQTGDDLFDPSVEKRSLLKLYGLGLIAEP